MNEQAPADPGMLVRAELVRTLGEQQLALIESNTSIRVLSERAQSAETKLETAKNACAEYATDIDKLRGKLDQLEAAQSPVQLDPYVERAVTDILNDGTAAACVQVADVVEDTLVENT